MDSRFTTRRRLLFKSPLLIHESQRKLLTNSYNIAYCIPKGLLPDLDNQAMFCYFNYIQSMFLILIFIYILSYECCATPAVLSNFYSLASLTLYYVILPVWDVQSCIVCVHILHWILKSCSWSPIGFIRQAPCSIYLLKHHNGLSITVSGFFKEKYQNSTWHFNVCVMS